MSGNGLLEGLHVVVAAVARGVPAEEAIIAAERLVDAATKLKLDVESVLGRPDATATEDDFADTLAAVEFVLQQSDSERIRALVRLRQQLVDKGLDPSPGLLIRIETAGSDGEVEAFDDGDGGTALCVTVAGIPRPVATGRCRTRR